MTSNFIIIVEFVFVVLSMIFVKLILIDNEKLSTKIKELEKLIKKNEQKEKY